jgi:hypothetical protein
MMLAKGTYFPTQQQKQSPDPQDRELIINPQLVKLAEIMVRTYYYPNARDPLVQSHVFEACLRNERLALRPHLDPSQSMELFTLRPNSPQYGFETPEGEVVRAFCQHHASLILSPTIISLWLRIHTVVSMLSEYFVGIPVPQKLAVFKRIWTKLWRLWKEIS